MSAGLGDAQVPDPIGEASARVAQLLAMTATLIEAAALLRARHVRREPSASRPVSARPGAATGNVVQLRPILVALPPVPLRPPLPAAPLRRQLTARPSNPRSTS